MKRLALALIVVACHQSDRHATADACRAAAAAIPRNVEIDRLPEPCVQIAETTRCREALRAATAKDLSTFDAAKAACADDPSITTLTPLLAYRVVKASRAAAPPPADPCPPILVDLAGDGAAVGSRVIAKCGASPDQAAIAIELCAAIKARTCDGQVIFGVDPTVMHGEVVSLMELAKNAGVTHLAIGSTASLPAGTPVPARCDEPTPTTCP